MDAPKTFYRRNLPHYQPAGGIFFLTFRLFGSIPAQRLKDMKDSFQVRKDEIRNGSHPLKNKLLLEMHKRYFQEYDHLLHAIQTGPTFLKLPDIASMVEKQLHLLDGHVYDLVAYCLMPNHVHLLIDTGIQLPEDLPADWVEDHSQLTPLHKILKQIKGPTAVGANRLLGRRGRFWHRESFDHLVRSGEELNRIVAYILNNPVKAGLVKDWDAHPYSFYKYL